MAGGRTGILKRSVPLKKMQKKKRKIAVVTGGAGFIGFHMCERLMEEDVRVLCVDNLITGSKNNLEDLARHREFEFIRHDVTKPIYVPGKVNYVLHLASPASPPDYLKAPIQTLKVGSLGTHNALGLSKEKRAVFLLASTSEVYGDPLVHPQPETYWGNVNPIGPRGVYDESKRFAEALTGAYRKSHGLQTRIVRIFNTYGPRMRPDDGRAIPTFISQALKNRPITVFGHGSQTRSFCYISDLIEGIWKMLTGRHLGPVNLGNQNEVSILQLAEKVVSLVGSRSKIVRRPLPEDDPKVRRPDIRLARRLLTWGPRVSLEDGLRMTIDWFRTCG